MPKLGCGPLGRDLVPSTRHGNEDPLSPAPLLRTWKEKTLVELTAFEAEEEAGGPASYCAPPQLLDFLCASLCSVLCRGSVRLCHLLSLVCCLHGL